MALNMLTWLFSFLHILIWSVYQQEFKWMAPSIYKGRVKGSQIERLLPHNAFILVYRVNDEHKQTGCGSGPRQGQSKILGQSTSHIPTLSSHWGSLPHFSFISSSWATKSETMTSSWFSGCCLSTHFDLDVKRLAWLGVSTNVVNYSFSVGWLLLLFFFFLLYLDAQQAISNPAWPVCVINANNESHLLYVWGNTKCSGTMPVTVRFWGNFDMLVIILWVCVVRKVLTVTFCLVWAASNQSLVFPFILYSII